MFVYVLPGQNKMSDQYERIRGGNGDFNSAQTCFRSLFRTFYSVLVIHMCVACVWEILSTCMQFRVSMYVCILVFKYVRIEDGTSNGILLHVEVSNL